jgi:alpha-L-rhamnosidase
MKPNLVVGFVLLGLGYWPEASGMDAGATQSNEPAIAEVERAFRELPMDNRRMLGPLFWLHGDESRERLEHFVGKVAEGGNGCFTAESRPHQDWLGEGWFRDLGICLDAAKKEGLKLWIFDEKWWPSQSVGGKVPPRYAAKQLEASAVDVEGPILHSATGNAGEHYIAAVAGRLGADDTIDGASLVDLAPFIRDGKLDWQAPAGRWKVIQFTYKLAPGLAQGGGTQLSVDGASKDCVDWFLQTVYQAHYERFPADFGKTIVGFFYDEPETRGDWGTELNRVLAERGVDWKRAYVAYKFQLSGDDQAAARYQYLEARAEAWGRTMYGGISRWCQEHGVRSIGHMMEHAGMYLLPEFCAGDLMRLQKYASMGGIDAVFSQFKPGQRAAYDAPCWQTPKLGSSVSHAYGKPDDVAMVEIFGARGQDLTYPEMKWWADHMQVSGINFLIPHSFNPRAPKDTDCPPYFYMEGFEPRWPLYRVFANYTSRLSLLLTGGRHVAPVALLFSGNTAQVGKAVPPDQISESLQDALYDCDWLPFEVFEQGTTVSGHDLQLRAESYQVLVVPPVEVIPWLTLNKAKEFFESGGTVLAYGFLPSRSGTLRRSSADIALLGREIWGEPKPGLVVCRTNAAGGRSYLLPEKPTPEQLQQVLANDAGIHPGLEILEGRADHWVHVLHRVKAGRDVFFIANQNHLGQPAHLPPASVGRGLSGALGCDAQRDLGHPPPPTGPASGTDDDV